MQLTYLSLILLICFAQFCFKEARPAMQAFKTNFVMKLLLSNYYVEIQVMGFCIFDLRHRMRKLTICILGENKAADQLCITAQLISALVFAAWIVQSLFFLSPKFQLYSLLLLLYRLVCVRHGRNPNCWFSHAQAHI